LGGRSLLRKALLCPPKRRKQPERYAPLCLKVLEGVITYLDMSKSILTQKKCIEKYTSLYIVIKMACIKNAFGIK
jgi:hypothetical protein